jgi:hypothetical protein
VLSALLTHSSIIALLLSNLIVARKFNPEIGAIVFPIPLFEKEGLGEIFFREWHYRCGDQLPVQTRPPRTQIPLNPPFPKGEENNHRPAHFAAFAFTNANALS